MPIPVATLDPVFVDHLDTMETVSSAAAAATTLLGQRQWMLPPLGGWDGDPYNIQGITLAFDRTTLNAQYVELVSDPDREAKIGEVMVTKLQVDYLAASERAFRTRHASSVRLRLHAAARRRGQGVSQGPFSGSIGLWLQRMLAAAHDDPTP
jgi:hypothetical protein